LKQESEVAILAGGCFWCLEAAYKMFRGVLSVESGYSGGSVKNPSYEAVCGGDTGHAEAVKVTFDPSIISYSDILDVFWTIHNPTTLNQQGNDIGTQYRSVIFYTTEEQKKTAEDSMKKAQKLWPDPIVTEIIPEETFYKAEDYHQNYFANNPSRAYCQIIINPKLKKLREKYITLLK
jgi:peptide-methionine (S)-S-oxide reductase